MYRPIWWSFDKPEDFCRLLSAENRVKDTIEYGLCGEVAQPVRRPLVNAALIGRNYSVARQPQVLYKIVHAPLHVDAANLQTERTSLLWRRCHVMRQSRNREVIQSRLGYLVSRFRSREMVHFWYGSNMSQLATASVDIFMRSSKRWLANM